MVTYRPVLDIDPDVASAIENLVATQRSELRSPWRALTCFDQAVLYLVWIHHDFTFAELNAHFSISTDRCASTPASYAGTNQDPYPAPYYSSKHHRHGVNVQGPVGLDKELLYLNETRCGSTHDTAAARADQIIDAGTELTTDLSHHGVPGTVHTPLKRKPGRGLPPRDQRTNREHARVRCPGKRGFAQLKAYKVLQRVRISPHQITTLTPRSTPASGYVHHSRGRRSKGLTIRAPRHPTDSNTQQSELLTTCHRASGPEVRLQYWA